jgi:preprotein translocase subunit SecG
MLTFFTVLHILVAIFMIFVILLQPGKEDGMGAALGGGGGAATTAFGGRGAESFLSKLTAGCAVLFFFTSLGLSFVGTKTSVAAVGPEEAAKTAPATAGTAAPAKAAPATDAAAKAPAAPAQNTAPATPAPAPAQNTAPAPTK